MRGHVAHFDYLPLLYAQPLNTDNTHLAAVFIPNDVSLLLTAAWPRPVALLQSKRHTSTTDVIAFANVNNDAPPQKHHSVWPTVVSGY
jgi:hypothetical protein